MLAAVLASHLSTALNPEFPLSISFPDNASGKAAEDDLSALTQPPVWDAGMEFQALALP